MKRYSDCYIAFIDILGFKEMIKRRSCNDLYEMYRCLQGKPLEYFNHDGTPVLDMNAVHMKVMSDSVCFYVEREIVNSLVGLIATCAYFQYDLLCLPDPVLSRGAITHGEIFADGDILFGPGFVKAYLMEEKSSKYPRIIMTQETIDLSMNQTAEEELDYIPRYTFLDFDEFNTVDTCKLLREKDRGGADCANLLAYLEEVLATFTDGSIREKAIYLKKSLLQWYRP